MIRLQHYNLFIYRKQNFRSYFTAQQLNMYNSNWTLSLSNSISLKNILNRRSGFTWRHNNFLSVGDSWFCYSIRANCPVLCYDRYLPKFIFNIRKPGMRKLLLVPREEQTKRTQFVIMHSIKKTSNTTRVTPSRLTLPCKILFMLWQFSLWLISLSTNAINTVLETQHNGYVSITQCN